MSSRKGIEKLVVIKSEEDDNGEEQLTRARAQRRTTRVAQQANGRRDSSPITLTRSKTLLLAALRVWELKHRVAPTT